MLRKCVLLPVSKYHFNKVLPNPSRSIPGSGLGRSDTGDWRLGHSDTGDWRLPVHQGDRDMKDPLQFRDVTVTKREVH